MVNRPFGLATPLPWLVGACGLPVYLNSYLQVLQESPNFARVSHDSPRAGNDFQGFVGRAILRLIPEDDASDIGARQAGLAQSQEAGSNLMPPDKEAFNPTLILYGVQAGELLPGFFKVGAQALDLPIQGRLHDGRDVRVKEGSGRLVDALL
jgi:hypothetical protein